MCRWTDCEFVVRDSERQFTRREFVHSCLAQPRQIANRRLRDRRGTRPDQKEERRGVPWLTAGRARWHEEKPGPAPCRQIGLRRANHQGIGLRADLAG